jgi:uncharacterized protein (DUF488 family)
MKRLVDVRRFPGSRRHPQFSREALEQSLADGGIAYVHEPELGGRREPRADSPNSAWRLAAFRGYADHMATTAFKQALDRLIRHASERPTAVMCAEAVPWRCHRQLISDALQARGVNVQHILGAGRTEPHKLNPAARPQPDGTIEYPAQAQRRLPLDPGS